jgi:hypothetical protein
VRLCGTHNQPGIIEKEDLEAGLREELWDSRIYNDEVVPCVSGGAGELHAGVVLEVQCNEYYDNKYLKGCHLSGYCSYAAIGLV